MIPAVTFLYGGDALLIRPWVDLHRRRGLTPVVVEDAASPLPPWLAGWLRDEGIDYRSSGFPRRGNLNGTDCAAGICGILGKVAADYRASYVFKVDCDTALLRPDLLLGRGSVCGLTWSSGGRGGIYGMCYAMTGHAARCIHIHLRQLPCDPAAPEDLTIWRAAGDLGLPRSTAEFAPERGPYCAVPPWADLAAAAARFACLTFGNPGPRGRSRTSIARALQALAQIALPPRFVADL